VTTTHYPSARTRLLWDEQLSAKVPQALRVLGFFTSHVGHEGDDAPARGSTDREVIEHAQQTNQIIVTSNHDMMLICEEAGQRFVWLDPRGRQYSRAAQVLLVFTQIERWEQLLGGSESDCVHALRTKCDPIAPADAARLALRRMRELRRRQRARSSTPRSLGELLDPP